MGALATPLKVLLKHGFHQKVPLKSVSRDDHRLIPHKSNSY